MKSLSVETAGKVKGVSKHLPSFIILHMFVCVPSGSEYRLRELCKELLGPVHKSASTAWEPNTLVRQQHSASWICFIYTYKCPDCSQIVCLPHIYKSNVFFFHLSTAVFSPIALSLISKFKFDRQSLAPVLSNLMYAYIAMSRSNFINIC